jgi:Protein of unknown function (DUF998)
MSVAEFPATFAPTTTPTTTAAAARRPRRAHLDRAARGAVAGSVAAVPPITALHLSATDPIEPSGWTISDYVVSLPHGTLLFALTTGALAVGASALAHGLGPVPGTRGIRVLLQVWAAALVVAAVFPTNLRGTPQDVSSNIHLYAGAVVFAALPIAGWRLARWLRRTEGAGDPARRPAAVLSAVSLLAGGLSVALIANRLPGVIGLPELMPPGILQRVAGAAQIALLAMSAIALLRSGRRTADAVMSR